MTRNEFTRRFPNASASTIAKNCPDVESGLHESLIVKPIPRLSTDEENLNKLERDYLAYLRGKGYQIGIQNVTLKLAHDCRLTVDFTYQVGSRIVFADTKGAHVWEDSLIKLRVAARLFPWISFEIVTRTKDGTWVVQVVKP